MTIAQSQISLQLSPSEIIEAIKKLSDRDQRTVWAAFNLPNSDLLLEPLPYVITLRDGKPINEQLDEIWQKRGPIDWSIIDDVSNKMDIKEAIEELLQSLTT